MELWKRYAYKDLGIIGEPFLDVDFDEVFYLTDTGRRWDGQAVSVRDGVGGQGPAVGEHRKRGKEDKRVRGLGGKHWPRFHSTSDIIAAIEAGRFPNKAMITVHPQRWTDNPVEWGKELVWQNVKNVIKKYLFVRK